MFLNIHRPSSLSPIHPPSHLIDSCTPKYSLLSPLIPHVPALPSCSRPLPPAASFPHHLPSSPQLIMHTPPGICSNNIRLVQERYLINVYVKDPLQDRLREREHTDQKTKMPFDRDAWPPKWASHTPCRKGVILTSSCSLSQRVGGTFLHRTLEGNIGADAHRIRSRRQENKFNRGIVGTFLCCCGNPRSRAPRWDACVAGGCLT